MSSGRIRGMAIICGLVLTSVVDAGAQELPSEYQAVLASLDKSGDFGDGVLKVNIPRTDLAVTIDGRPAPTPFGFGGWIALTKGEGGQDVMMGDRVGSTPGRRSQVRMRTPWSLAMSRCSRMR